MFEADLLPSLASVDGGELLLGDVVLAQGVCAREAEAKGVALADHAAHLVVHGTLHLLGYDHEQGEAEAVAMEEVEREALAAPGIADPYEVHSGRATTIVPASRRSGRHSSGEASGASCS